MFVDQKDQRRKKLEHLIHQEIAQVLYHILCSEHSKEDLRVTVMEVHSSKDLRKADVFLSTSSPEAFNMIRQKSAKIRFILAKRVSLRRMPEINFLPWAEG
ncbi:MULTISPECIES: ribosome-binding factor A [Holospora]|uniref:Ribosome-binding factor A n=2 Tax=Holospora TaxID=44747 RepID=A0A061JI64_9PROT|nr:MULTISPECIES: ribosome-binding factor A [Holospora]ETZ04699.1 ribosome-binding factor A [Holospora undulata HU1]GAJ46415.1 ribosome-binding factor A [Holospora elegans E1]